MPRNLIPSGASIKAVRSGDPRKRLTDGDRLYLLLLVKGGKPSRGSPNKVPFVAAVQTTEAGAPELVCFSKRPFTKASIEEFAANSLAAPATLVSDGLGCFTAVQGTAILHEPHVTGGGAACVKLPQFLAINTVLGNLKAAFAGTYHAFGFSKYARRYLAQVQYLFNRRFDLGTSLLRLVRATCLTCAQPLRAIRAAEYSC